MRKAKTIKISITELIQKVQTGEIQLYSGMIKVTCSVDIWLKSRPRFLGYNWGSSVTAPGGACF
jgi:hypothetical protein